MRRRRRRRRRRRHGARPCRSSRPWKTTTGRRERLAPRAIPCTRAKALLALGVHAEHIGLGNILTHIVPDDGFRETAKSAPSTPSSFAPDVQVQVRLRGPRLRADRAPPRKPELKARFDKMLKSLEEKGFVDKDILPVLKALEQQTPGKLTIFSSEQIAFELAKVFALPPWGQRSVDTPPDGNCLLHNQAVAELDEQRTFVMRRALANTHGLDPTHQAVIFGKLAWCALMPGAHDGDTSTGSRDDLDELIRRMAVGDAAAAEEWASAYRGTAAAQHGRRYASCLSSEAPPDFAFGQSLSMSSEANTRMEYM